MKYGTIFKTVLLIFYSLYAFPNFDKDKIIALVRDRYYKKLHPSIQEAIDFEHDVRFEVRRKNNSNAIRIKVGDYMIDLYGITNTELLALKTFDHGWNPLIYSRPFYYPNQIPK